MKMLSLWILVLLVGCGKTVHKSSSSKQNVKSYYNSPALTINVYYEPGAEPYTSESNLIIPIYYWTILETNLKALFTGRAIEPQISVPKTLAQMTLLPLSSDQSWSLEDVMSLNKTNQKNSDPNTFNIYFVNGRASENDNILGFHISNSTTMVIFKDVIRATASLGESEAVAKYVEQATIVHEMGHALGLVNNGVSMQTEHQDVANGHHCSNTECVMYWSNEGTSGLVNFVKKAILNQSTVMFAGECLKDTRSY